MKIVYTDHMSTHPAMICVVNIPLIDTISPYSTQLGKDSYLKSTKYTIAILKTSSARGKIAFAITPSQ